MNYNNGNSSSSNQYSMERVLFNLHHKVCMFALRRTSSRLRSLAERSLLILAVCGFAVLLLSHLSFVYRTGSSSSSDGSSSPYYGYYFSLSSTRTSRANTAASSTSSWRTSTPYTCLQQVPGFSKDADITHLMLIEEDDEEKSSTSSSSFSSNSPTTRPSSWATTVWPTNTAKTEPVCQNITRHLDDSYIYFSYSRVKGYLLLPKNIPPEQHNISVQHVFVSKTDVHCFGEPFLQRIIFTLLGPDTVMMNWLLALIHDDDDEEESLQATTTTSRAATKSLVGGYVYNPRTDLLLDLHPTSSSSSSTAILSIESADETRSQSSTTSSSSSSSSLIGWLLLHVPRLLRDVVETLDKKLALVLKTSFLFFITTTLVSFTLRETQERMVDFTHQLHWNVRNRRPIFRLIMSHFIDNLVFVPIMVGMIFFLIEFYQGDKVLAFMVLSIVWICEVFCLVSLRTKEGIHFFPRVFFLLFSMFHFYLFSFPFGFSYTAFASTVCFMVHSMLFFWHRYELPAVARGLVTMENPRINSRRPLPSAAAGPPPTMFAPGAASPSPPVGHQRIIPPPTQPLATATTTTTSTAPPRPLMNPVPPGMSPPQHQQQHPPAVRGVPRRNSFPAAWIPTAGSNSVGSGMSTPPTPFLYPVIPQPMVGMRRSLSHTTSSTANTSQGGGRISRQPSMTGLFRSDTEDDEDEDFIFFMGGEVVMHRPGGAPHPTAGAANASSVAYAAQVQQQQQQHHQQHQQPLYYHDSSSQRQPHHPGMLIDTSSHGGSSEALHQHLQQVQPQERISAGGGRIPDHVLASVGVAPAPLPTTSENNGSLLDPANNIQTRLEPQQHQRQHRSIPPVICSNTTPSSSPPPSPPSVVVLVNQSGGDDDDDTCSNSNNTTNSNSMIVDPPETSALQAILNISTPLRDNHGHSSTRYDDCRSQRSRAPPSFPTLDDD